MRAVVCLLQIVLGFFHSNSEDTEEMAHSSNVMIHGSTFISAQGDLHIHNRDSESGKHSFMSVQKSILIDEWIKDFII